MWEIYADPVAWVNIVADGHGPVWDFQVITLSTDPTV